MAEFDYQNFNDQRLPVNIEDEMRKSYLDYAMSVIIGRALPDVRDGLKPVHRRILYGMYEQGNFGSLDGDNPAAMRYTEVRLTKLAEELMRDDIDKETVDWVPNYDGTEKEPAVLPAKYPNLLVNGSSGIAVGMATNIPPHNLGETIDACLMMIDNPQATVV